MKQSLLFSLFLHSTKYLPSPSTQKQYSYLSSFLFKMLRISSMWNTETLYYDLEQVTYHVFPLVFNIDMYQSSNVKKSPVAYENHHGLKIFNTFSIYMSSTFLGRWLTTAKWPSKLVECELMLSQYLARKMYYQRQSLLFTNRFQSILFIT